MKRREVVGAEELATDGWRGEEMLLSPEGRVKAVGGSS